LPDTVDVGNTLVVTDYRGEDGYSLELTGALCAALLACGRVIHRDDLIARTPGFASATLGEALERLSERGLIVEEGGSVWGLPVRSRLPNGAPRAWGSNA
jgi:hypothetical protein